MKLLINALSKFLVGLVLVGALLFLSAGGFDYVNGWLFIGLCHSGQDRKRRKDTGKRSQGLF